jgi:hypothetical protein
MGIISLNRACEKNGIKMSTSRLFCLIPFLSFVLLPAIASASDLTSVITRPVPDGGHAIVAKTDAGGVIHLLYDAEGGPWYVKSSDDGTTFSQPVALVDPASRKPGLEFITWDMVVGADGTVHAVLGNNAWKLKLPQDEWGCFYTSLASGQATFAPLRNINHKPSEGFSIAVRDDGTVTLVWMADRLFANVSRDNGRTFAAAVEIDPQLNPCNCCTTSSVYGADGKLAVLYREETNNDRDMYLALWDQQLQKVTKTRISTEPWKIDSCPMTYFSLARSGRGYTAAWPTKGQIFWAKLDGSGKPLSPGEVSAPGRNGMRTGVLVLPAQNGSTLIAWKKDQQIGWQAYEASGKPLGQPGKANSPGNGAAGVITAKGRVVLFR